MTPNQDPANRHSEFSDIPIVDARGALCPWPLLQCKAALAKISPGQRICILATDPLAELDLRSLCAREGHLLLELRTNVVAADQHEISAWIEKATQA